MNPCHKKVENAITPGEPTPTREEIDTSTPSRAVDEPEPEEENEEVQHNTSKGKERGKYRQYEDSQTLIEKIRSYRTQRYPDSEIMKLLDNMPRRTYYNYVKKLQEQDRQIMQQWMEEHEEQVSEEMTIHRETLCQKIREVQAIIDNKTTSAKDKMQAIQQQIAISDKLVNFTANGRPRDMKAAKYERTNLF